jgi:hypothetical protein
MNSDQYLNWIPERSSARLHNRIFYVTGLLLNLPTFSHGLQPSVPYQIMFESLCTNTKWNGILSMFFLVWLVPHVMICKHHANQLESFLNMLSKWELVCSVSNVVSMYTLLIGWLSGFDLCRERWPIYIYKCQMHLSSISVIIVIISVYFYWNFNVDWILKRCINMNLEKMLFDIIMIIQVHSSQAKY